MGTLLAKPATAPSAHALLEAAALTLTNELGGTSPRRRRAAERALTSGRLPVAEHALRRLLYDPRPAVSRAAARVYRVAFGHTVESLAVIERLLLDRATFELAVPATAGLVPRLVAVVSRMLARPAAAQAWSQLGHALAYLPQLRERILQVLARHDRPATADELRVLRGTTDGCGPAVAVYRRALASPQEEASNQARLALLSLQQIVDVPVEEHRALFASQLPHVRANAIACASILRTDPPATWEVFVRALRDRSPLVRSTAAITLAKRFRELPPDVSAALERLMRKDRNGAVRMSAAHGVAHLGPDRDGALALLKAGATARHERTRKAARDALSCLGA